MLFVYSLRCKVLKCIRLLPSVSVTARKHCFVEPRQKNHAASYFAWNGITTQIKVTSQSNFESVSSTSCPFKQPWEGRREGGVALLVKGNPLQPQQGRRMLPFFLSVTRSWLMLAAFYLSVYRHSARLSPVTGSCTNLRPAAGRWEQLSWD